MSQRRNLFLITCSGTKRKNSKSHTDYTNSNTIKQTLSHTSEKLLEGRRKALKLITESGIITDGIKLSEHPYNKQLQVGKDFGGEAVSKYLEAVYRYNGRFYRELGEHGIYDLLNSEHDFLILSGLYGVISPVEPIQLYECNLEELQEFHNNWTQDDLLTNILLDYIENNDITSIVDLTSQHEYRNLIYWKRLYEKEDLNVLHAHNQNFAGPQALIEMATYLKKSLLTMKASEFSIKETKPENNCCLTSSIIPPEGWPMETSARIKKALEEGETNTREFKVALTGGTRDHPLHIRKSTLKYRCMKSISALMNTEGGELFVGIDDKTRRVQGIMNDLMPYNKTVDKYLQILDRMVLFYIGALHVQNVRPQIWSYENKPILIINVLKGKRKAYLNYNEWGHSERTYWIRFNASDKRLYGKELKEYIKQRFG